MGQRHVAAAERIHLAQHAQRAADRMAAFHPQQRSDPPRLPRPGDIVGAGRELQVLRIARDQPLHHVDLLERRLNRLRLAEIGRDEHRPKLRPDMALAQAVEIGVHHRPGIVRRGLGSLGRVGGVAEIEARKDVLAPVAQLFGNVVVAVPHRSRAQCLLRDLLGRWRSGG